MKCSCRPINVIVVVLRFQSVVKGIDKWNTIAFFPIENGFLDGGKNQSAIEAVTVDIRIVVKLENALPQQVRFMDV